MENIHKSFGKLKVLNGINLDLSTHGIHAILGPNGSGKTTLMKILLGMVIPDEGSIYLNNRKVNGEWKYREDIDYVSQIARFPDNLKVRELVKMVKSFRNKKERSDELIRLFKMEQYLDHKLGELSGGSRQKVNLILAFMFDSPVIVLDEPTSGLDPVAVMVLKDLIRKERVKGKVILMSTHIMDLVEEIADQIIFLLEGRVLYTGTVEDLQKMNKAVRLDEAIANLMESRYA